jgi:hypothetical protein
MVRAASSALAARGRGSTASNEDDMHKRIASFVLPIGLMRRVGNNFVFNRCAD